MKIGKVLDRLDLPPLWLLLYLAALGALGGVGPHLYGPVWDGIGIALIALALGLMGWAVAAMRAARTTIVPHRDPQALVTGGPFRWTRNPIYLGDAIVLLGAVFWTGTLLGLSLVPLFVAIITRRFILPEEDRLRAAFGQRFADWAADVRRWI